jgi:hypothetical protein
VLALADARVQQRPRLGALGPWVPAALAVAEAEDALLGTGLVFVAAAAAERGIEAVFRKCVEQRDRLQPVAAGARPDVFHYATLVDGLLHAGNHQPHAPVAHQLVAVFDDLGEVVAGVHVHHRKRQACRREREHSEVQQHRAVLAAAEQQHRVLALGGHFADDGDGFVGERIEMGSRGELSGVGCHRRAHPCSPHSVLAWPLQRPARLSSPGATGRVHGQQPMLT